MSRRSGFLFTRGAGFEESGRCLELLDRRGFTLIEMMLSLTIVAIITLACASVVTMAARATTGNGTTAATQATSIRNATDLLASDLKMAISFSSASSTAATFTVPDRLGTGSPQTVSYSWNGVGGSIMRQFNGGTAVSIADNVQNFNLGFLSKTVTAPPVESPEQLLDSRDWGTAADIKSQSLNSNCMAECFTPILPTNAISWKITHVKFKLQRNGTSTGLLTVQVNALTAGKPSGSALTSTTLDITTISSTGWTWVDLVFPPAGGLTPGTAMAVIAVNSAASPIGFIAYDQKATDNTMTETKGNASVGGFSAPVSGTALEYYVYGTVTTQN